MMSKTVATGVAMPEWLARRDVTNGAWEVQRGDAKRGQAWTNQHDRVMRVPFGGDETNRVIRAHEMMHARVTPMNAILGTERGLTEGSIRAAEEFRVNQLVSTAGFDMDMLVDGSEKMAGERLAEMGDFEGLVHSVAATANTKGCAAFLRGVKGIDPDLGKALRELEKGIIKTWTSIGGRHNSDARRAKKVGSTRPCASEGWQGYPAGYRDFTIPLAQMLDLAIDALTPDEEGEEPGNGDGENEGENNRAKQDNVRGVLRGEHGRWGTLLFDNEIRLTKVVRGSLGRKRVATNMGRNPRRLNRMLTDPQRRVFDRKVKGSGGVVLIDQSGSMSLSVEEIEAMMEASPGCTIIGYSHKARSVDIPNIWVLADNGRRVGTVPAKRAGNGVDGPAVRYALSKIKHGETFVWVCDGMVTSGDNDQCYDNLTEECARLVKRHGIHMTRNVTDGVKALQRVAKGERLGTNYVGMVHNMAVRKRLI